VNAWHLSGHRHQENNEGLRAAVQLTFWGLGALALGFLVLRIEPMLPPLYEVSLRKIDLTIKNTAAPPGLWKTRIDRAAFLNRSVWTIRFSGSLDPEIIDLELTSQDPLTIFNCSFPFVLNAQGRAAKIVVGRQPPLPLVVQLTLPVETRAQLEIKAINRTTRNIELLDSVEFSP
jgi:hypothetical protein